MSKPAAPNTKNFLLSKTFWVNLVSLAALVAPGVRDWLASNPVEVLGALAAVNLILRFVTSGAVSFSSDGVDGGKSSGGNSGGLLPLAIFLTVAAFSLPSCADSGYPLTGSISYRDPGSGAKGGLVLTPGEAPRASVRVPVYGENGELIGMGELSGSLGRAVTPSK